MNERIKRGLRLIAIGIAIYVAAAAIVDGDGARGVAVVMWLAALAFLGIGLRFVYEGLRTSRGKKAT